MARKRGSGGSAANDDTTNRFQLGPFWLWYRAQRDDWCICWYDDGGGTGERRTRRKSTGIGGGSIDKPPQAAKDELIAHYEGWRTPENAPINEVFVESLMADFLLDASGAAPAKDGKRKQRARLSDPGRYATSVTHWQKFFALERKAGRLTGAPVVGDIKNALVSRFIDWRLDQGKSPHTVSRDVAALRQPLNWAWKNEMIASAPFIPDVPNKPEGKTIVYTPEQIAAFLEAAIAQPDREHVHLLAMIALSTHGRIEAILELEADQIEDGLIYFNAPGRAQTKKRRSIVPIAPTLAPWLEGRSGRIIQAKRVRIDPKTLNTVLVPEPVQSVKRAFASCLLAAGISEHQLDDDGRAMWLEPREKLGETQRRPLMVPLGSPNTLRHTCSTEMHRRGIPEAQIDAAAGHSGDSTNKRHYRHLRPGYLSEFIEGVEDFWSEVGKFTDAHLRYQRDTKVVSLATSRAARRQKKA